MKCVNCGHPLSPDEVNANLCWKCGTIINPALLSEDKAEASKIMADIELAQEEQEKKEKLEEEESIIPERKVISFLHSFFTVISLLALLGGIIWGVELKNFFIAAVMCTSVCLTYCVLRLLIAIAYLLCDIRENSALPKVGK